MWQLFLSFLDYKDKKSCAFDTKCECTQCKWGCGNPQGRVNAAVIGWFTFNGISNQLVAHESQAEVILQVMSTGGNGSTLGLTCFSLGAGCIVRLHQTQTNFHQKCVTVIIIIVIDIIMIKFKTFIIPIHITHALHLNSTKRYLLAPYHRHDGDRYHYDQDHQSNHDHDRHLDPHHQYLPSHHQ